MTSADISTRQSGSSIGKYEKQAIRPSLSLKGVMSGVAIFLMIVLIYCWVDPRNAIPVDFDTDSDAQVAGQMLEEAMMDRLSVVRGLESILEAGSNVGIGAAVFATMYPEATIVGIEPSTTTFSMLRLNTARFSNVVRVHSGLWNRVTSLAIVQMGRGWAFSGAWTIQVMEVDKVPSTASILDTLPAVSVPFLLKELNLSRFDLAKIDVEGSEREIFQNSAENNLTWLDESRMAVIEVHDDMRKGAEMTVRNAFVDRKERWHFLAQEGEELYYVIDGVDGIPPNP